MPQYLFSRPKPWAFLALGLAIGVIIAAGLLFWQKTAADAQIDRLTRRLESAEASASSSSALFEDIEQQLRSAETSIDALSVQNSQLASELASTRSALASATALLDEASRTVTITERAVSPSSIAASGTITLEVKLKGKADKVQMKIVGVSVTGFTKTYNLSKVSTASGVETWRKTITAPGTAGTYRYYATAWVGTKTFEMPGVSAWTFQVTAP